MSGDACAGRTCFDDVWPALADAQDGVVGRWQLLQAGLTPGQARRAVRMPGWRTVLPGVYVTFTGPLPARTRIWAALVYAGEGAAASHRTALFLTGVIDAMPNPIDVTIPHARKVRPIRGIRLHRRRSWSIHPAARPPRTTVEDAVLDTASAGSDESVVLDVVLRAAQRRVTTPARLRAAVISRPRIRWRRLVLDLIGDAAQGVLSALERVYRDRVERPHGLPPGKRNGTRTRTSGTIRYWDVDYERWNTLVELDGLAYHPDDERHIDHRKENSGTISGRRVLHYGWRDAYLFPCSVAAEVAAVLRSQGWQGTLNACGPACTARAREVG